MRGNINSVVSLTAIPTRLCDRSLINYTSIYNVMQTVHSPTDAHLLKLLLQFTLKLRRNFTECFNVNITSARLNCKLPDDGRRPKHVGAI